MKKKYKKISIIIPVFNEKTYISQIIKKVIKAKTLGLKKEIIVVDDGSSDGTTQILKKIEKEYKNIQFVYKKQNQGKGSAVKIGFLRSTGDIVLIQDADLEYNPDEYPFLIEPILKDYADVVYGSRFFSYRPHRVLYFWHSVANLFLTTLSNMLTNLNLTDMETGFKVFRGDLIRKIAPKLKSKGFGFEPEITARLAKIKGIRFYEVGISYFGRTYAEGKHINWIDGIKAIWQIIRYNIFH